MQRTLLQRLLEKGRVLSKTNETKLRAAIASLQEVLAGVAGGLPMNEAQRAQFQSAGIALLEAELSFDQRRQAVQKALRAGHSGRYCYVSEMFETWLVYECYDDTSDMLQLYKVSYVVDESTGVVTFGATTAVLARIVYEPIGTMQEAAAGGSGEMMRLVEGCMPLVEGALRRDGTVPIKIIQPGWGSSGYYPAEVLERDGPKVFTAGTHMYWNHPTVTESIERPERDLSDLAAVLTSDARWDADGAAGPGLYADAAVKQAYTEAVTDLAADIGVSINTSGRARMGDAEGRSGPIVEALVADPLSSIDFVTKPGAGGQILQLFESARHRPTPAASPATSTTQEGTNVTEQEAQALRESETRLQTENGRLREALLLREARDFVGATLAGRSDLLEATKTRIASQMAARVDALPMKDGALDQEAYKAKIEEAVTIEQTYLAAVGGTGEIHGMGGDSSGAGAGDTADLAALEAQLQASFASIGLSESAAKIAAGGR